MDCRPRITVATVTTSIGCIGVDEALDAAESLAGPGVAMTIAHAQHERPGTFDMIYGAPYSFREELRVRLEGNSKVTIELLGEDDPRQAEACRVCGCAKFTAPAGGTGCILAERCDVGPLCSTHALAHRISGHHGEGCEEPIEDADGQPQRRMIARR